MKKFEKPFQYLVEPFSVALDTWKVFQVIGSDREKFFQNQLTQDILTLPLNTGTLNTRINRQGQIQFYCYLIKYSDSLKVLIPEKKEKLFKEEMQKFIIMDDVEIVEISKKYFLNFNNTKKTNDDAKIRFYGLNAQVVTEPSFDVIKLDELEIFRRMSFFPSDNSEEYLGNIVNDTIFNDYAVSYRKGCFLGQETIAKIENNRGAAYYPVVFKLKNKLNQDLNNRQFNIENRKGGILGLSFEWNGTSYIQGTLFRDYRVQGKKLEILIDDQSLEVEVSLAPFLRNKNDNDYLELLKDLSQFLFLSHQEDDALYLLDKVSNLFPRDAEVLEMYGALLGRMGKLSKAIEVFDRLEIVDPTSVMAHTNKSLYYMKLGEIEKAENEKSMATVKSFAKNADEAKLKKIQEEENEKKKQEIKKREGMFLKVLEIDPVDTVANQGLGDVYYQNGLYEKALYHLELALAENDKLSVSYLLAGKSFEALGKKQEAKKIYEYGIQVASKQGDMMPANEMQSRLNNLK